MRYYCPFDQLRRQPTIVVDSTAAGAALVLAHWRGAPTPPELRDDSSAGSVLRALHAPATPGLEATAVTANHFDVDGFVGVWSLLHPELALQHEPLLRLTALLGDFRELDWTHPAADHALAQPHLDVSSGAGGGPGEPSQPETAETVRGPLVQPSPQGGC